MADQTEPTELNLICTDQTSRTFRQVGWQGFTGRFYSLGEDPSPTEKGGFMPLWIQAHCDPLVGHEVVVLPSAEDVTA
jgi:hypothetical protein